MDKKPLTPKELAVLEFITNFIERKVVAPSYEEIRDHFKYVSLFSVQQFLKQLESKGHLRLGGGNKKRAIEILFDREERGGGSGDEVELPLLGKVAAGRPIEAISLRESVGVPQAMISGRVGDYFALRVSGDSMIDDGILDQDIVIIRKQSDASNGQTVVALVNNEATIKRFYSKKGHVELQPANPAYQPIVVKDDTSFKIEGILCGLIRRYK